MLERYPDAVTYSISRGEINKKLKEKGITSHKKIYNRSNHYTRVGNEAYAEVVADVLSEQQWGRAERDFYFEPDENTFKKSK